MRKICLTLSLLLLAGLNAGRARASFVNHHAAVAPAAHVNHFVAHEASLHAAQAKDLSLAGLEQRRDLNPARFDHYHPHIGPVLADIERLQAGQCQQPVTLVRSLLARQALNPARFNHYHPLLGPLLKTDLTMRSAMCDTCPPLNGILPLTPFYNYLRWRRSLNPARFDHYHPRIGLLLAEDQLLRSGALNPVCPNMPPPPPQLPQIILPPPSSTTTGGNGPPPPLPPLPPTPPSPTGFSVPEPSAFILLAIGTAAFAPALARRRRPR